MVRRTSDDDPLIDDPNSTDIRIVERIIERSAKDVKSGSYGHLKDVVFVAIILSAGAIIWAQQSAIDSIRTEIAGLKLKCDKPPVYRGSPH